MKNFMKVADEQICIARADGSVDDYFEAFFSAFEGNPAVLKRADDPSFSLASLSDNGKATLKKFLSDPNAGKLWEIDVPAIVGNEPAVPHNYWIRGLLGELDIYQRVYKPAGYAHDATAVGFDFKRVVNGVPVEYVQIKTLKNPDGAYQAMKKAVDDLVALSSPPEELKLHILKKPGSSSDQLESQLDDYIETISQADQDRLEVVIKPFELAQ